ncbi:MAG TPA: hypothetical protein VF234_02200 [Limnochordia bacterium]
MRKVTGLFVAVALLVSSTGFPVWAQEQQAGAATAALGTLPETLGRVEQVLYGRVQDGPLISRIERVEQDLYGQAQQGPLLVRVERMRGFLQLNPSNGGASLLLQLNAAEWMIYQRLTMGDPIMKRLDTVEAGIFGETRKGPIAERIGALASLVWPEGDVNPTSVTVPAGTLVKIRLETEVNSASNKVGDPIRYRVAEDLVINNVVAIPAGAQGSGSVLEVESAGGLGRNGLVRVDFGTVGGIDGTRIPIRIDQLATEKNRSLEVAAGASMAGVLLLGPIGVVTGYFVRGREHVVPVGTEFYVEVEADTALTGISLVPTID